MSKLFSIGLEVEEVAVGRVLRQLDGMAGVAKINLNLTGQRRGELTEESTHDVIQKALAAPVKPRQVHKTDDPRGRLDRAIADAIKNGELGSKQLTNFLQRRGFSRKSLASILNRMFTDSHIERGSRPGFWQLTPAGRKQFFGNQKDPSPALSRPKARNGTGGKKYKEVKPTDNKWLYRPVDNSIGVRRLVLDLLREGPKTTKEVATALVAHGKSDKNLSGTVYKMRTIPPSLVKLSNGIYSLTPHGEKEIARIIEAEQSRQSPQPQTQAAE